MCRLGGHRHVMCHSVRCTWMNSVPLSKWSGAPSYGLGPCRLFVCHHYASPQVAFINLCGDGNKIATSATACTTFSLRPNRLVTMAVASPCRWGVGYKCASRARTHRLHTRHTRQLATTVLDVRALTPTDTGAPRRVAWLRSATAARPAEGLAPAARGCELGNSAQRGIPVGACTPGHLARGPPRAHRSARGRRGRQREQRRPRLSSRDRDGRARRRSAAAVRAGGPLRERMHFALSRSY